MTKTTFYFVFGALVPIDVVQGRCRLSSGQDCLAKVVAEKIEAQISPGEAFVRA